MTDRNPCPQCERPTPEDAFVCRTCVDEMRRQVLNVAFLMTHADEKRARRGTNWKTGTVRRSPETPLPFDPRVTDALNPFVNVLITTARMIEDETGDEWPGEELRLALWIRERAAWASKQEWASHLVREIRHGHDRVVRVFDIPPEEYAIGVCGAEREDGTTCPEELSAPAKEGAHRCPRCAHEHDVGARRKAMLDKAEDLLFTPDEAARALRLTEYDVDARLVRAVVRHFGIQPRRAKMTTDIKGRPRSVDTYPLGEIREGIHAMEGDTEVRKSVRRIMRGKPSTSDVAV